jgi:hypothetical protein
MEEAACLRVHIEDDSSVPAPGSATLIRKADSDSSKAVIASSNISTTMQARDLVACKCTSADPEPGITCKADGGLLDTSDVVVAENQSFVPDLSKCLRGCLNPAQGVHHAKCPNHKKRVPATVEVPSKALLVPAEIGCGDRPCELRSKDPEATLHVRQQAPTTISVLTSREQPATMDLASPGVVSQVPNMQSLDGSVNLHACKDDGSVASTSVSGMLRHEDLASQQNSVKDFLPCSTALLTQDSVACECTSVDADTVVAAEADSVFFNQSDDSASEHECAASAAFVPKGLVSERIQQHLKFIRSQC